MINEEVNAGVHSYGNERGYCRPQDALVRERLDWWQDQKLGFMVHWGPYSQWGAVESWALSDEDGVWSRNGLVFDGGAEELKREYRALNRTFNPARFRPDDWAQAAKEGGFKYFVFTTKHHDGFAMFDTKLSDYKITGLECPYRENRNADICRALFDAFRARGIEIATYFSKADWHCPDYWDPGRPQAARSRGPNYDTAAEPEKWERFVDFTHGQILELISGYGPIRVLWLDAGWVRAARNQDLRMEELARKCRELQPGLIIVDRTVAGPFEDYLTPEQTVPAEPLLVPWEACVTMGDSFSYKFDDHYKPVRTLIHLLIDIVAKGGNLALNAGAQPDGRLPENALKRMKEMGAWLDIYGEAIYGTRAAAPYRIGDYAFTCKPGCVYCFRMYEEESAAAGGECLIPFGGDIRSVELLGDDKALPFRKAVNGLAVELPKTVGSAPIAHVMKLIIH